MTKAAATKSPARLAVEQIVAITDRVCVEHLDEEYAALCHKAVAKLARKRPSPLLRGEARTWAGGVIYSIGMVNFLSNPTQRPHMTTEQLSQVTGVGKSTLSAKARVIHDLLGLGPMDLAYCRRDMLAKNPLAWMVQINGFMVDARTLPPEVQAEARRRGLIPDLPPDGPET
jgi:hypothetical protein